MLDPDRKLFERDQRFEADDVLTYDKPYRRVHIHGQGRAYLPDTIPVANPPTKGTSPASPRADIRFSDGLTS